MFKISHQQLINECQQIAKTYQYQYNMEYVPEIREFNVIMETNKLMLEVMLDVYGEIIPTYILLNERGKG